MIDEESWETIKAKWISEGRMPDSEGFYHYTPNPEEKIFYDPEV